MGRFFIKENKHKEVVLVKTDSKSGKWCALEVSLEIKDGKQRLSVCGSTGHMSRTANARDDVYRLMTIDNKGIYLILESCGQIREDLDNWFPEYKENFKWHLNDMNPGCIHQREMDWHSCQGYHNTDKNEVCEHNPKKFPRYPIMNNGQLEYYDWQKKPVDLKKKEYFSHQQKFCWKDAVNIPCPTCGYKYGTQWLYEALPQEVIDWFNNLKKESEEAK
jgi:hypothetical protein